MQMKEALAFTRASADGRETAYFFFARFLAFFAFAFFAMTTSMLVLANRSLLAHQRLVECSML
jgi:hypothetical protein